MAVNANNSLAPRHVTYCGTTGAGKAVAVKLAGHVGKCVAIFDVYGDYAPSKLRSLSGLGNGRQVHQYTSRRTFYNAFVAAWASGRPFAVSYMPNKTGDALRADALWFGELMWAAADGNRELHVIWEEMQTYCTTTGRDSSIIGQCATGGRKFGLVNHFVFQRPVEVSKTYTTQSPFKYIGAQEAMIDARFWCEEVNCTMDEIIELGSMNDECQQKNQLRRHYLFKSPGIGNYSKKHIDF